MVNQKIRDAEAAKAQMFPLTGKDNSVVSQPINSSTAQIDETYIVVGGHLDQATIQKIKTVSLWISVS